MFKSLTLPNSIKESYRQVSGVLIMSVKRKTTRIDSQVKVTQKDMQNNEINYVKM